MSCPGQPAPFDDIVRVADYLLQKNAELYRRLAAQPTAPPLSPPSPLLEENAVSASEQRNTDNG
jgi:hypothetical protein